MLYENTLFPEGSGPNDYQIVKSIDEITCPILRRSLDRIPLFTTCSTCGESKRIIKYKGNFLIPKDSPCILGSPPIHTDPYPT